MLVSARHLCVSFRARISNTRSVHWLIVTLDSPQQFQVAKRGGVEKLVASPALSLPLVVPSPVPSPQSNREAPVACTCERITGQEKLHVHIHLTFKFCFCLRRNEVCGLILYATGESMQHVTYAIGEILLRFSHLM